MLKANDSPKVAAIVSQVLGKPIEHESLSPEKFKAMLLHEGVAVELADYLVKMDRRVATNEFDRTVDTVRVMCEREPKAFDDFVKDNRQVWL